MWLLGLPPPPLFLKLCAYCQVKSAVEFFERLFLQLLLSWWQGHVYSLGSTLSAALTYVIEPELEAELGEEIQRLLQQMQEETPEDRPLLQVQNHLHL